MPDLSAENASNGSLPTGRIVHGLVALTAADRDERADGAPTRRSELVLADAGFSYQEIAALTGKNREAVRSTLRRLTKDSESKGTRK